MTELNASVRAVNARKMTIFVSIDGPKDNHPARWGELKNAWTWLPSLAAGGVDARSRNVAKPPQLAQTGWCGQELLDHTTPSALSKEAPLLLLDVAALPVRLFEGCDQRFLPKDVPQFIQAFQQTGSREAVDLKMSAN